MTRPVITLFMLMSVDGKISTGATDEMDVDSDFPRIEGIKEGLHQYYEIEQTTDLWSFNTGRVQAKMGVNEKPIPDKTPVSFVIYDNKMASIGATISASTATPNYTLVFDNYNSGGQGNVLVALEFKNGNDVDIYGKGGIIPKGATFYLAAELELGSKTIRCTCME